MAEPEIRTDLRSRWPAYLATLFVLGLVGVIAALALHKAARPPATPTAGAFATPDWRCAPTSDDHPVCWRELPRATKLSAKPIPAE